DVHPVLQTALAVALEARALCLELCRHAVEDGGGLLQIDVADRRGDETAHVARRVRLEIVPERCQPVRTRLGRQAWMPSEPSLVRPLVHLGSRVLRLRLVPATSGPVEDGRSKQQQGDDHTRDENAMDAVTERPAAHQRTSRDGKRRLAGGAGAHSQGWMILIPLKRQKIPLLKPYVVSP